MTGAFDRKRPASRSPLRPSRSGDRAALARAITLMESRRPDHRAAARGLLQDLMPRTGHAVRVGITGVPGVGKSTTIDALGSLLTGEGTRSPCWPSIRVRPAPAAPSSATRRAWRALPPIPNAFIRPSPSSGTLGGVAAKTREAMLLCEAAGFDVILVETVGVGQSETAVADLTDFFLVLMLPGAGDELQGIKKGILELADMIAVNKADDVRRPRGGGGGRIPGGAAHPDPRPAATWTPPVVTVSGLTGRARGTVAKGRRPPRAASTPIGELAAPSAARRTRNGCGRSSMSALHEMRLTPIRPCATRLPQSKEP